MDEGIPTILHPLLRKYLSLIETVMPGRITACYLVGSIAFGAFNPRLSDIDFIAVLDRPASQTDVETLLKIHKQIQKQYPQWKLDGMYLQIEDFGCPDDGVRPYLRYLDGRLKVSDRFVPSSVTWWILKKRGIALSGPLPESLPYAVDMYDLVQKPLENLNTYWASWTSNFRRRLALPSDWGVEWSVLGVLRLYLTIRESTITSKSDAGA